MKLSMVHHGRRDARRHSSVKYNGMVHGTYHGSMDGTMVESMDESSSVAWSMASSMDDHGFVR